MLRLALTTLLALLPAALAVPHPTKFERRHSDCFSYNQQGCAYPVEGKQGAVATVSALPTPGSTQAHRDRFLLCIIAPRWAAR